MAAEIGKISALPISAAESIQVFESQTRPPAIPSGKNSPHRIRNGGVYRLDELLGVNRFRLAAPTVLELKKTFPNDGGPSLAVEAALPSVEPSRSIN
jgi:hypothetical protein